MFPWNSATKGSARSQIGIEEVRDGILKLPGNRYRAVLATSSLNFELLSSPEQDAIVDTFQAFLNSLTHPVQVLVRIRELDVDRYLEDFALRRAGENEMHYKKQLENYSSFIRTLVSGNKILSRRFYLILPYENREKHEFDVVREQILMEEELIVKGLEKLGMTARSLSSLEILELFYSFYAPEKAKSQPLLETLLTHAYEYSKK